VSGCRNDGESHDCARLNALFWSSPCVLAYPQLMTLACAASVLMYAELDECPEPWWLACKTSTPPCDNAGDLIATLSASL
jgi:hypothetical protein